MGRETRNPYSSYSGYKSPSRPAGSTTDTSGPESTGSDYPVKNKEHSAAEHLAVLQKYHDDKKKEHGAMWRAPEQFSKDVAVHSAMAQIERAFPKRK